jgi:hypothetical protein
MADALLTPSKIRKCERVVYDYARRCIMSITLLLAVSYRNNLEIIFDFKSSASAIPPPGRADKKK